MTPALNPLTRVALQVGNRRRYNQAVHGGEIGCGGTAPRKAASNYLGGVSSGTRERACYGPNRLDPSVGCLYHRSQISLRTIDRLVMRIVSSERPTIYICQFDRRHKYANVILDALYLWRYYMRNNLRQQSTTIPGIFHYHPTTSVM